jgi:hypothetical protein
MPFQIGGGHVFGEGGHQGVCVRSGLTSIPEKVASEIWCE